MHPIVVVAALLAAGLHAYFFLLESVWFMRPAVHRRFGIATEADARIARSFAYNQGFYNLFLAVGAALGIARAAVGDPGNGVPLMLFACGSMVAAGIVLVTHNAKFAPAAAIQIVPPLVAIAAQVALG
jgi:putative membrane protein